MTWLNDVLWRSEEMSRLMSKPTKLPVLPAKTQISLGIHPVWSESSLCTQWVAKDPRFLHADSEDSDQTGHMPKLICVFDGRTGHFVGFDVLWLNLSFHYQQIPIFSILLVVSHIRKKQVKLTRSLACMTITWNVSFTYSRVSFTIPSPFGRWTTGFSVKKHKFMYE